MSDERDPGGGPPDDDAAPQAERSERDSGGSLIRVAIERPVTVVVCVLLVLLFGALSLASIPIQLTPDIVVPTVTVQTEWPGAAPTEVEAEILDEQEDVLEDLPGLERMTSLASPNRARVKLELKVGASLEDALVRVTNRLAQVTDYPESARPPVVSTANSNGPPLAVVLIQSQSGGSMNRYRTWVEHEILPSLERIRGVADVRLIGGRDREIEISFDPAALASRGLPLERVARLIQAELRDISGGDVTMGKRRYLVRTPVAPDRPKQLEELVLSTSDEGIPVRLGDVAQVRYGLRKPRAQVFSDGSPSLALLFHREAGSNVLEVTQKIKKTVAELQRARVAALGLKMRLVFDQTGYIHGALDLVRQNLLIGAVLAVAVLLFFLRSASAAAVVSISIPVCVIGTALGMALLGRTVNIVSLAGMAFAVGMVVDNSIVVLENIHTWRGLGYSPARAALVGTREVWGAILASTLTTAVVFIPIAGWQDEVGELLRDVAVAISVAVFISLAVSVFVISSLSARLLRRPPREAGGVFAAGGARIRGWIGRCVAWIVSSWSRALLVAALAMGGAVGVSWALLPPMEYLPTGNRNMVFGILVPPPGYAVEELARIGKRVQKQMVRHTQVERDGVPAIARSFFVALPERAFMGASAVDPQRTDGVMQFMRRVQGQIPGVFRIATRASLFGRRIGGGRSIEIDISGADLRKLVAAGRRLMGAVRKALPGAQARPIPSLDLGAPELQVHPRRKQLSAVGMTGAELGLAVDALVDGAIIGELSRRGEPKLDVVLRARARRIRTPEALAAAPIATPQGKVVPLASLAEVPEVLGPSVIQRIERRRAITIMIAPPKAIPLERAMAKVRRDVLRPALRSGELGDGVRFDVAGTAGQLERAKGRLGWVLALAVLICALLMAAVFEDFLAPLAIIVTVPLAAAGGLAGLWLVDRLLGRQPLDMMTAMGFLILVGVVVNNAILVVDGALARMREGEPLADAVAGAVQRRVRPIFMSTLTSLAGLLPLVLATGFGSELYRGVGSVVLAGLAVATVLTLFVVPAAFSLLWRLRRAR